MLIGTMPQLVDGQCANDTDGDGNCHLCFREPLGCPATRQPKADLEDEDDSDVEDEEDEDDDDDWDESDLE